MFEYRKSSNVGNAPEIIQVPANNGTTYTIGQALFLSSGVASACTGTNVPVYICAENKTAVTGDKIACYRVEKNQEYATVTSADGALTVGTKVTTNATGDKVTATTTNGVAEVVEAFGTTSGSKVYVRF